MIVREAQGLPLSQGYETKKFDRVAKRGKDAASGVPLSETFRHWCVLAGAATFLRTLGHMKRSDCFCRERGVQKGRS